MVDQHVVAAIGADHVGAGAGIDGVVAGAGQHRDSRGIGDEDLIAAVAGGDQKRRTAADRQRDIRRGILDDRFKGGAARHTVIVRIALYLNVGSGIWHLDVASDLDRNRGSIIGRGPGGGGDQIIQDLLPDGRIDGRRQQSGQVGLRETGRGHAVLLPDESRDLCWLLAHSIKNAALDDPGRRRYWSVNLNQSLV